MRHSGSLLCGHYVAPGLIFWGLKIGAVMAKLLESSNQENGRRSLIFFCPGCKRYHSFIIQRGEKSDPLWTWNDDMDKPTFSPSLGVNMQMPEHRCHLFLRDGKIQFLNDSHHELAGQTVELPEVD